MTQSEVPTTIGWRGSRREILNYAWLASLGILIVKVAGVSIHFSLPRNRDGQFGGLVTLGPLIGLPQPGDPPLNHPAGKFWLVHTQAGLLALYKVCTHLDCLSNWDDQSGHFVCPCHGSQFDRAGANQSGPAPRPLDRFVVRIVSTSGAFLAATDPQTGAPLPLPTSDDAGDDVIIQVDTGQRIKIDAGKVPTNAGQPNQPL